MRWLFYLWFFEELLHCFLRWNSWLLSLFSRYHQYHLLRNLSFLICAFILGWHSVSFTHTFPLPKLPAHYDSHITFTITCLRWRPCSILWSFTPLSCACASSLFGIPSPSDKCLVIHHTQRSQHSAMSLLPSPARTSCWDPLSSLYSFLYCNTKHNPFYYLFIGALKRTKCFFLNYFQNTIRERAVFMSPFRIHFYSDTNGRVTS